MNQSVKNYNAFQETLVASDGGFQGIHRNKPIYAQGVSYHDSSMNISVRPPFGRQDYEAYRPGERIPTGKTQEDLREIMWACQHAYESVGIVRSVIDMMAEFIADGVKISDTNETINNFYKVWMPKVNLQERATQFAKWALNSGNVVVRREFAKLNTNNTRKLPVNNAGKVPVKYIFYNPANIEAIGDFISTVSDNKLYGLRIPLNIFHTFSNPKNDLERKVYDELPQEIKDALKNTTYKGTMYVPLPEEKMFVTSFNKNDTDIWATSFVYGVLGDIYYNNKLKQAKLSALDGVINYVRLWKLGDHTKDLLPTPAAATKLANIISNHTGGGGMDIIWSSDIDLKEFYPPVDKLVGFEEKYNSILVGLGVPLNVVGGEEKTTGTPNMLGMKNMISRIEGVRKLLIQWLKEEIAIISKNMGFKSNTTIQFNYSNLFDERVYFTLLKDLVDRNVISDSRVLELLKENPDAIRKDLQTEEEMRKNGELPSKASPFHTPQLNQQQSHEIKKIKLQAEKDAENAMNSRNMTEKVGKNPSGGRPSGSKDKQPRQMARGELLLKAHDVYNFIDNYLTTFTLSNYAVADVRKLTSIQKKELEESKLFILPHIPPTSILSEDTFVQACSDLSGPSHIFANNLKNLFGEAKLDHLSNEQKKAFIIEAYVNSWLNCE